MEESKWAGETEALRDSCIQCHFVHHKSPQGRAREKLATNFLSCDMVHDNDDGGPLHNSLKPLNPKEGISISIKNGTSIETSHTVQEQVLIRHVIKLVKSPDSSAGIAAGCRLDGLGLIHGRVKTFLFSVVSRLALRLTQPPILSVPEILSPRRG
jgi:hypothetical protein